jgi:uncharacterized protein YtpQ (UPF0354 family)
MEESMNDPISRRMILRLLGGSVALALVPTRALSDTEEDGFRQTVIVLLSRRHPEWHVELGADPQTIKIGTAEIYLDNIYRYVRDLPAAERDDKIVALIENGVARSATSPEKPEFAAASNRIRPQIVPPDYLRQARDLVHRAFFAGLIVAYAIDEKERYELIRQPDIDSWHVGQPEIEARAIENLEAVSAEISLSPRSNPDGGAFVAVSTTDGYDAARLLLPQFMRRVRQALNASLIFAGIPNRDFLVAWTPEFGPRRGFATKITQDFERRPHPLTDSLLHPTTAGFAWPMPLRCEITAAEAKSGRPIAAHWSFPGGDKFRLIRGVSLAYSSSSSS